MSQIKLYELVDQHKQLEALLDSDDIPVEAIRDSLDALQGDLEAKATSIAHLVLNLENFGDQISSVAAATKERADRAYRRAESIRYYLLLGLQAVGIKKIECPQFTITVQSNPASVEISDDAVLPDKFMVTPEPPPPRPDKKALVAALKAGEDIPGAWLKQGEHLRIRV